MTKLPDDVELAINKFGTEQYYGRPMTKTRAALVQKIIEYGDKRAQDAATAEAGQIPDDRLQTCRHCGGFIPCAC